MELNTDRIPRLVNGSSFFFMSNPNVSSIVFHITTNAFSVDFCESLMANSLIFFLLFYSGTLSKTSIELAVNLVRLKQALVGDIFDQLDGVFSRWYWLKQIVYIEIPSDGCVSFVVLYNICVAADIFSAKLLHLGDETAPNIWTFILKSTGSPLKSPSAPSQESQKTSLSFWYPHLIKHLFYISNESCLVLSKAK